MNIPAYMQQYPPAQGSAFNQIIRRPLTDAERQLPSRLYKTLQNSLRGISVFCLILFVFSTYLLATFITDPVTYDSISITLNIFMAVFGAVAIGMSVNAISVRKKIADAMRDGTGVEVFGPAYRTGSMGKVQTWTVGPVSIMPTRGLETMLQEGMPTSVLCIPRIKAAIAINNCELRQGARIMFPPNLEAMAMSVGALAMQPSGPPAQAPYPSYPQAYAPPQQMASDEDLPPPPTD